MSVINWTILDVKDWLIKEKMSVDVISVITCNCLDGPCILSLNERDFSEYPINTLKLGDRKHLFLLVKSLQRQNHSAMIQLGLAEPTIKHFASANFLASNLSNLNYEVGRGVGDCREHLNNNDLDMDAQSSPASEDGRASKLKPEVWKAFLSLCYVFLVTWVTAVVMVIVHDKVPDMKKYPPLPDLFLDNVPHIPWAFDMCEITGSVLMAIWIGVLLFHKHRFILLRRFFALSGTVFLLRCITMLITSLSVPGGHLKCAPRHYPSDTEPYSNWSRRLGQAYAIWTGAGMSVRGVRTCGDYMFSGHTVALTLLNFFITEYTSRSLYLLHIVTWLMNMFGIFFILAAHEHYSIDVFIAFYITSRLFLYYHTLSNNQALMQGDSMRTRIWFPLLSFFESEVDGIVPNEYENPLVIFSVMKSWISQLFRDISESSVARMAGNSISQQAAKADFSVGRLMDNIKKNIIAPGSTDLPRARKSITILSDKNVQASMSNDGDMCQLQHCIGSLCKHDVVLSRSSDSVHLKDN